MRSRGFTLIELLVVIAIIALLIGLSVPVLQSSREHARATICAARVKQLLVGLLSYDTQDGTFPYGFQGSTDVSPPSKPYPGIPGSIDPAGRWWLDFSQDVDHLTKDGLDALTCPSKWLADGNLAVDILCGNYGANLSICKTDGGYGLPYRVEFEGRPLSSCQVQRPSEMMLLVDSGYSLISWWHATAEPPVRFPPPLPMQLVAIKHTAYIPGMSINRNKTLRPGQFEDAVWGRHPGKTVNVGFVDGSVGAKTKAEDLLVAKTGDGEWDNYPLWNPCRTPVTPPAAAP